jgi:hypothetical protein
MLKPTNTTTQFSAPLKASKERTSRQIIWKNETTQFNPSKVTIDYLLQTRSLITWHDDDLKACLTTG